MSIGRELLRKLFESGMLDRLSAIEVGQLLAQHEKDEITPRQGLEEYKRGYAQAELDLKREPLSEDKINSLAKKSLEKFNYSDVDGDNNWAFRINENAFARAIEKAHGITGDGE